MATDDDRRVAARTAGWATYDARYFHALGVLPRSAAHLAKDDVANGPRVVVLSDRLWQRRFCRDPAIIGRAITLDDNSYTVIGIMPGLRERLVTDGRGLDAAAA